MKSKTPITCWSCNTVYDYQKHEVCPICENHFLDGQMRMQALPPSPVSGTRVSICIDYGRAKLKALPAALLALLLLVASCTHHSCPTYSNTDTPIPRYPSELTATDSTAVEKDRFSLAEKTGAVLFVLFAVYATDNAKD